MNPALAIGIGLGSALALRSASATAAVGSVIEAPAAEWYPRALSKLHQLTGFPGNRFVLVAAAMKAASIASFGANPDHRDYPGPMRHAGLEGLCQQWNAAAEFVHGKYIPLANQLRPELSLAWEALLLRHSRHYTMSRGITNQVPESLTGTRETWMAIEAFARGLDYYRTVEADVLYPKADDMGPIEFVGLAASKVVSGVLGPVARAAGGALGDALDEVGGQLVTAGIVLGGAYLIYRGVA